MTLPACLATLPTAATQSLAEAPVPENGLGPLTGKVFGDGSKLLIITLHGDVSSGGPANYIYEFAELISRKYRNDATVVALLRPGYYDDEDRQSPGTNHNRFDQYTAQNNKAVADTITNLKTALQPSNVLVVGHSGGAAQLGAIIGQYPDLIDGALLVSCPCNLLKWRAGRRQMPRSQSPIRYVDSVGNSTKVIAVTGENDDNTKPALAREYIAALVERGIDATVKITPGAGHHRLRQMQFDILSSLDELYR